MEIDQLWTMQEAMAACKINSRSTFYKRLEEWRQAGLPTPYVNLNPTGKYETRRFRPNLLQQCIEQFQEKVSAPRKESPVHMQNQL